jgi:trans-2,3-dihydro-3-hydroxyanthranilate isomerase
MTGYAYILADVFTDRPFTGNPLAVFPDAEGLTGAQMQSIAREMNLSETTFVTSGAEPGTWRVRIFTPGMELPFAGHPTIGTALVLAHLGRTKERAEIVLEEGIGPVRVVLGDGNAVFFVEGAPERPPLDVGDDAIAAAVGVGSLASPAWQAGYGVPFLFVPVMDVDAVAKSAMQMEQWNALPPIWARGVYVHAVTGRNGAHRTVHARMYAPGKIGVPEDPATGSAAAAFAGSASVPGQWTITQGVEMGRPSNILAETLFANGAVSGVVAEAHLIRLP